MTSLLSFLGGAFVGAVLATVTALAYVEKLNQEHAAERRDWSGERLRLVGQIRQEQARKTLRVIHCNRSNAR